MASVPTLGAGSAHPLPTTAAADDALREALARQAAARAVAEAADQRAADLLAAAGAASSSSSTPLTTPPQSPTLATAAADAAGRDNAILEAARRSFAIGAQASGNHPEQQNELWLVSSSRLLGAGVKKTRSPPVSPLILALRGLSRETSILDFRFSWLASSFPIGTTDELGSVA